ncbi:Sec-independent protein translocase TatB [Nitrosomonas aestuarii]|uniref:Sec-independent protein translocase protein TatB n=1 Tax=Nitrosomonas aestuarii TaxID=52441 RepID=A0A1I3YQU5_9PROT|nr:Sec-independent protein translocase protein TatB [Nitrosomonas aestuarii]SFK34337.1 Sec-independent protein translocase TatB [Nitrosomonas aestuarii]
MFDISFFEIMIISMIALIVIGPERLPQVARTLGHLIGRCRQFVYSVKTDIHNEIRMEELKNMHNTMHETVQSIEDSVRKEIDEIKSATDIDSTQETTEAKPEAATNKAKTDSLTKPVTQDSRQLRHDTPDKDNASSSHE